MHHINVDDEWLTNGELSICILKTLPPEESHYTHDTSRPENINLLRDLVNKKSSGTTRLNEVSQSNPVLVLAGELAFSSSDYNEIKNLLESYNSKIIFIGGFGFTLGKNLNKLSILENVVSSWDSNSLVDDSIYNCGWIWIKDKAHTLKCYLFIKTYIDQTHETPLTVIEGKKIIQIQTQDLIIFPLICSELLCNRQNNPREKILKSLLETPPKASQKILVTVSSFEPDPSKNFWQAGIGNLLNNSHNIRLLITNCSVPSPREDEQKDKWRCLSGAFQKIGTMKEPDPSLPYVRFAKDSQFEGLILRNSNFGIAAGKLIWTSDPSTGKYVLSINFRDDWTNSKLTIHGYPAIAEELLRIIDRYKRKTLAAGEYEVKPLGKHVAIEVDSFKAAISSLSSLDKENLSRELFNRSLFGIDIDKRSIVCDRMKEDEAFSFCRAFLSLLLIKYSLGLSISFKEIRYGQMLAESLKQEILVWKSPELKSRSMLEKLEKLAIESGSAVVLTVVGEGNGIGTSPDSQKVSSNRLTDFSLSKSANSITSARDRVIYWQRLGEIEDIYVKDGDLTLLQKEIQEIFQEIITDAA